jgi:UDP-N-acetylmuramoylalanine--D-glutamate ligase
LTKLVILGAGESGTGAAVLAKKMGIPVFVSDQGIIKEKYKTILSEQNIDWEEGKHTEEKILNATEIIKSPGISEKADIIKTLRKKNISIVDELEFASRYTKAKIIAVTGSNGKSTTTMLTYHMLKKAGLNVGLAGNIGKSMALQVAENDFEWFVLEVSSFQLDTMHKFKADIAILLNITPDHLDRYNYEIQNYINSKFRIIQNQTESDHFIYCSDDEVIISELKKIVSKAKKYSISLNKETESGAYIKENNLIIHTNNQTFEMSIHDLALQGKHNAYNSMAAGIAGRVIDIRKEIIRESLSDFENIEHRLEFVAKIHGISFINDSKATNINSTWYALESQNDPVILILGGVDKGNDYSILEPLVKQKVKAIICLGKDNQKLHDFFEGKVETIVDASSAQEAVQQGYRLGKKDDVVLLSPACASFDLFENYEDRGRQFKTSVRAL